MYKKIKQILEKNHYQHYEISNFCPALDIAGIRHETLGVRLYMS